MTTTCCAKMCICMCLYGEHKSLLIQNGCSEGELPTVEETIEDSDLQFRNANAKLENSTREMQIRVLVF